MKQLSGFFLAVSCCAVLASGCAKHEVIQKDQGIAPAASTAPIAPIAPVKKAEAVQPKAVEQPAVQPAAQPVVQPTEAPKPVDQQAALKAGLTKIYFNFDSASLSEDARNVLSKDAELIKAVRTAKIRVEGNCDERGSDDYNLALGEKRAKEAVQYLVNLGIPAEQLSAISYGKEKPVAIGHDEASRAKNRRDDFVLVQ